MKFQASPTRHMHVGDQTRGNINMIRIKKLFG